MDIGQAAILSVVEGVSEFLPISSTGHLVLVSDLLSLSQSEFVKSFEIIIQLGAILAVIAFYWRRLLGNVHLWKQIVIAFVPTGVLGLIFYNLIKSVLLGNLMVTVISLAIGGLVIILVERYYGQNMKAVYGLEKLNYRKAFLIGLIQSLSMIPGVSRAAATISGGLMFGLRREAAVEFSFMLAIPTMMAATGFDLVKTGFRFSGHEYYLLLIGLGGAFISALIVIKWFLKYVQNHTLTWFGIYRIVLAILFWVLIVR